MVRTKTILILINNANGLNFFLEPRWKTIVYVAVGTASAIFTVIAFVCLAKYAVLKYRKDPVIEFYSPRSLYNQTPVYTARLDETSPNDSGSFSD